MLETAQAVALPKDISGGSHQNPDRRLTLVRKEMALRWLLPSRVQALGWWSYSLDTVRRITRHQEANSSLFSCVVS